MNEKRVVRGRVAEKRGRRSEMLAAALLILKGYRILGRRVRTRAGEIDLVARAPGGVICFIEVKARDAADAALDSVGWRQRGRIGQAAQLWLASRPGLRPKAVRYDVIALAPGRMPHHLRDAWRDEGR
ncbi:MAG TPA: YraN family protein [Rhizomicrobium sp.]|nr:YraN family protein [Rhizomicrobium sp.]